MVLVHSYKAWNHWIDLALMFQEASRITELHNEDEKGAYIDPFTQAQIGLTWPADHGKDFGFSSKSSGRILNKVLISFTFKKGPDIICIKWRQKEDSLGSYFRNSGKNRCWPWLGWREQQTEVGKYEKICGWRTNRAWWQTEYGKGRFEGNEGSFQPILTQSGNPGRGPVSEASVVMKILSLTYLRGSLVCLKWSLG